VNLRPTEIKGAKDVWHKRALPGYRIELIAGPPFHLYVLTVVDEMVKDAQRSFKPLAIDLNTLDLDKGDPILQPTMITLYNGSVLNAYTVTGLFDRVSRYFESRPTLPTCDTQVTVKLNRDWAFPRLIIEEWAQDCQADATPPAMAVVGFSTLTPTPDQPTPTATTTATPTISVTPTATTTPTRSASPSPTGFSTPHAKPRDNPTPLPDHTTSGVDISPWMALLASVMILGAFLIRFNGKINSHQRRSPPKDGV
jgi:hypothetical protein